LAAGIDALSTTAVAAAAGVPVASVYQYFADRDAIIGALIERHVVAMDEQLADAIDALTLFSVRTLVEATVMAYVAGYARRSSYVILWFQGRVSPEIVTFVRKRSEQLATRYHAFAIATGLIAADTQVLVFELVAEMIDAFLAVAYRDHLTGDERVVSEGIEMTISYLSRYATEKGIAGVPVGQLKAGLDIGATG
jgi:AcrR family transcriptional regulator